MNPKTLTVQAAVGQEGIVLYDFRSRLSKAERTISRVFFYIQLIPDNSTGLRDAHKDR